MGAGWHQGGCKAVGVELAFQECGEKEVDEMEVGADGAEVTCVVFQWVMGSRGSRGSRGRGCGWTRCSGDRLGHRLAGLLPTCTSIWGDILCHKLF